MNTLWGAALAVALLLGVVPAQAQSRYSCRSGNGSVQLQDRPCTGASTTTSSGASGVNSSFVSVGPVPAAPVYQAPIPKIGEAPPHVKYMSARCSSLNDALRTADARGLKPETKNEMRTNYQRECADDEREAYSRLNQDRRDQYAQRQAARQSEQAEAERASLRAQQCGESKRILVTKRARTDLTEGEKNELKRFEENYRSRCG